MNEKDSYMYTYPRVVYNEKSDVKGLLFVAGIMGGSYLLFIAAISYKLGFM